jgi:hypothetical protein
MGIRQAVSKQEADGFGANARIWAFLAVKDRRRA